MTTQTQVKANSAKPVKREKVTKISQGDLENSLLIRAALKAIKTGEDDLIAPAPGTYEFRNKQVTVCMDAIKIVKAEPYEKSAAGPLPWNKLIAYMLLELSVPKRTEILKKVGELLSHSLDTGIDIEEVLTTEQELKPTILAWQIMCKEKAGTVMQGGNCTITIMGANFKVSDIEA